MIEIICVRGLGDKEASEINDPLITSENIAVQRGTNFINGEWYKKKSRTIRVPYKDGVTIGAISSVYESKLNIVGNHIVTSHGFEITQTSISSTIAIEQHEENI